jgi:hypothetical protein
MSRINVPSPSELRRPRSGADVMAETFRLVRTDPDLVRFTRQTFANPKYSTGLRAANERRRLQAIERRAAVGAPAGRTATGRISRAKYSNPGERRAGALAKRQATIARRDANTLRNIIIPISDDVSEPAPRRPSLSDEERQARRAANMNRPTVVFSDIEVVENPRRNTYGRDIKFEATMLSDSNLNKKRLVAKILEQIAQFPGARIQVKFNSNDRFTSTKLKADLTEADIEDAAEYLEQSLVALMRGSTVSVGISVRPFSGGSSLHVPDFLKKGYGVTVILNEDNSCGLRCLVLAMCTDVKRRNLLKAARASQLNKEVEALALSIGQSTQDQMDFTDFDKKFIYMYPQYQVVFLSKSPSGVSFVYETEAKVDEPTIIHIFWDVEQSHYHLIHDVQAFTNDRGYNHKWCGKCKKSILKQHFANHSCVDIKCKCCTLRFSTEKELEEHMAPKQWRNCKACNMPMVSDVCQEAHKCNGKTWRCGSCKKWMDIDHKDSHTCGEKKCEACGEHYTGDNHRCFIKKLENTEKHDDPQYWVYDFESRMIHTDHGSTHEVDTVVAMKLYGDEQESFKNLGDFVKWTMTHKRTTFIAHNARSYDGWMVWQYLLSNTHERPTGLVLAGNKVMLMKYKSNKYIDSLSHVASALEGLPKIFGLDETQFKKGFFPYRFNTRENAGYKGPIPDASWYDPHMMKTKKKVEFEAWHAAQKDVVFDLDKDRYEYCVSDVLILKKAMETYRDLCLEKFNLDPLKCVTIASFSMKNFRTNFMKEENIAVLTKTEYEFIARVIGGRTNAAKLYHKWTPQQIKKGICGRKIDIQSLYPTTQFYDDIPVGIPTWDNTETTFASQSEMLAYIDTHFGFIECDVVCPKNDFFPTLPEKKDGKLMFDLLDKNHYVVTSAELKRAVEKGYKVTRVYKSLVFTRSNSVFKSYVATLLQGKVEASGAPSGDIEEFINEHKRRFGFDIDRSKLVRNEGLRCLYKMCLNSLWGKLGEKCDRKEDKYCTTDEQWVSLLARHVKGEIEITDSWIIGGDTMHAKFKQLDEKKTTLARTNIGVAAFVTSNARLRLGEKLDILGPRAFYFDTDSILYHYDPSLTNIEEGDYLGDWEKENKSPIVEFCAMGPKSYAVLEQSNKTETKMKGFTLNHANAAKVNLTTMKRLIDGELEEGQKTNEVPHISGNHLIFVKKGGKITTLKPEKSNKFAVFNYTKRIVVGDYNTVPIGWEGPLPDFV